MKSKNLQLAVFDFQYKWFLFLFTPNFGEMIPFEVGEVSLSTHRICIPVSFGPEPWGK